MKYSLLTAGSSHLGSPIVFLIIKPIATEKNTDSNPVALIGANPLKYCAKREMRKMTV